MNYFKVILHRDFNQGDKFMDGSAALCQKAFGPLQFVIVHQYIGAPDLHPVFLMEAQNYES